MNVVSRDGIPQLTFLIVGDGESVRYGSLLPGMSCGLVLVVCCQLRKCSPHVAEEEEGPGG